MRMYEHRVFVRNNKISRRFVIQNRRNSIVYEPGRSDIFTDTALELLPLLRADAEQFWQTHAPTMQRNA